MAQKVAIELIDDLDGQAAAETVRFTVDGVDYEIDLSDANAATLRQHLSPYVAAARRVRPAGRRRGTPSPRHVDTAASNEAVRAWARANGYQVADRGRIRQEVIRAYHAAGN